MMSTITMGCQRKQAEDGSWTVIITTSGLTDDEARKLVDLTAQRFQGAIVQATAERGFDTKIDHVTGERTPLKPETRQ